MQKIFPKIYNPCKISFSWSRRIVVNMFLHTTGPLLGSGIPFTKVIFWNFLPVTIGNIVGGMVFIGMLWNLNKI